MMRFEFKEGSGIAIGADCYRFVERIRDVRRSPVFRHIGTDEPKTFPDDEIRRLIQDPMFRFLTPAEVGEIEETGLPPQGPGIVFLEDIKSEWERTRAACYEKYAVVWDRAGRPLLTDRALRPSLHVSHANRATQSHPVPGLCAVLSLDGSPTAARSRVC